MSEGGLDKRYLTPPEEAIIGIVCPPGGVCPTGNDFEREAESEGKRPGDGGGRLVGALSKVRHRQRILAKRWTLINFPSGNEQQN